MPRFPKSARLRTRREFLEVQDGKDSLKVSSACLLGLSLPNGTPQTRLGLTVSSKVGNAVTRNRIRRQLREWFRSHIEELPKGHDVVIIARSSAATATVEELAAAFARVALGLRGKAGSARAASPRVGEAPSAAGSAGPDGSSPRGRA